MKSRLKVALALARARAIALRHRAPLAPGALTPDESPFWLDQEHLLRLHRRHGPIFKVWWMHKMTTCIVGPALGGRFLAENKGRLMPVTADRRPLFPEGFLRGMEGPTHMAYRRRFLAAFKAVSLEAQEEAIRAIFRDRLAALVGGGGQADSAAVTRAMRSAATAVFVLLILGAEDKSAVADAFTRAFEDYMPGTQRVFVGESERAGFARIRALAIEQAARLARRDGPALSLLEHMIKSPEFDDTVMGNLLQMVENARFDTHGLWRWLLLEIAGQPGYLARIRAEGAWPRRAVLASSAVREMLRTQQSEYLHRGAAETLVFDGFAIPARTWVRICIWEGHRDPAHFERPDVYLPDRFVGARIGADIYAPLGLDHHKCLGAQWTYDLGALLVDEIARHFSVSVIRRGPPAKEQFHFEPGPDTVLAWAPRESDDADQQQLSRVSP